MSFHHFRCVQTHIYFGTFFLFVFQMANKVPMTATFRGLFANMIILEKHIREKIEIISCLTLYCQPILMSSLFKKSSQFEVISSQSLVLRFI